MQEEVDAAKKAVEQQAEAVRELKEVKGLANCDPEVQAAVEVLLERKAVLGELEERLKGAEAP